MPKKFRVDGDHSDRLPPGTKRVGYDHETGIRYYTVEGDDRVYQGRPGAEYGIITPIGPPPARQQPQQSSRSVSSPTFPSRPSTSGSGSTLVPSPSSSQVEFGPPRRSHTEPAAFAIPQTPVEGHRSPEAPGGPSVSARRDSFAVSGDESGASGSENEQGKPRSSSMVRAISKKLKRTFSVSAPTEERHIPFSPVSPAESSSYRPGSAVSQRASPLAPALPVPTTFDGILGNEEVRQVMDKRSGRQNDSNNNGLHRQDTILKYRKILRRTTWSF